MQFFASRRFFTLWFGLGLTPLACGSVLVSWGIHPLLGLATAVVLVGFLWLRARTTCCRCPGYGTLYCGLPGLLAPWLARRQSAASLPLRTVRLHLGIDLATMAYFNAIYSFSPWLPVSLVWSLVAILIVFLPRRHHGLLDRLRRDEAQPGRLALPMVSPR